MYSNAVAVVHVCDCCSKFFLPSRVGVKLLHSVCVSTQLARVVAQCNALAQGYWNVIGVPADEIADVTSSALAAVASADICGAYCNAIAYVVTFHEENREVCGIGVVSTVLDMMEAHTTSKAVQSDACAALNGLVENAECAEHMREDGRAAVLLRKALAACPGDDNLKRNAADALKRIDKAA